VAQPLEPRIAWPASDGHVPYFLRDDETHTSEYVRKLCSNIEGPSRPFRRRHHIDRPFVQVRPFELSIDAVAEEGIEKVLDLKRVAGF
jgi:hypothetical protein